MPSYSQLGQDLWVLGLFPTPGYFVDIGAGDGRLNSNSLALEEAGWQGVCVEPDREFAALAQNRRCFVDHRCIWREAGIVTFKEVDRCLHHSGIVDCFADHLDRRVGPVSQKEAITLPALLRSVGAPPLIEYLSLDTEGSEWEILQVHDFQAYRFQAITVEHNFVEAKRAQIRELLEREGYVLKASPDVDDWYLWENYRGRNGAV